MNRVLFTFARVFAPLLFASLVVACGENRTFPPRNGYVPGDPGTLGCIPNLDGQIDSSELQPALGVPVSLLVSPVGTERAVSVEGSIVDGRRVWSDDLDYAEDQLARISASALEGHWFADSFPEGEFVAPVDAGGRVLGVYRHDDDALRLFGLASATENPPEGTTLYVYTAPVELYQFPIIQDAEHVSIGEVSGGMLRGLPYAGRDVYEVLVVATGVLELPDFIFEQAQRVDTRVTIEPAVGVAVSTRQVSWLFECFGEVARATSRNDETNMNFDVAAEVRRLSLER